MNIPKATQKWPLPKQYYSHKKTVQDYKKKMFI